MPVCLSTHCRAAERTNGSAGENLFFSCRFIALSSAEQEHLTTLSGAGENIQVTDGLNFCNLFFGRREMFSLTGEGNVQISSNKECFASADKYVFGFKTFVGHCNLLIEYLFQQIRFLEMFPGLHSLFFQTPTRRCIHLIAAAPEFWVCVFQTPPRVFKFLQFLRCFQFDCNLYISNSSPRRQYPDGDRYHLVVIRSDLTDVI